MPDIVKQLACRKVAVFSDIHSNYYAFQACYEDAKSHGADGFLFLGDYISDLADPVKTLELVYEIQAQYPTICLRGNRERYMLDFESGTTQFTHGSKTGSLLYTYKQLRAQDLAFIKSLPIYGKIEINGVPFEIAHAIQSNDRYYFDDEDDRIQGIFPQMETAYLLTGHSHKQYCQRRDGKTILNPGSIGVPRGYGNWTQYALLDVKGGVVNFEFHQLPYDLAPVIHSQFASGLVAYANCWAIGVLYDVITGEEYALELLDQVNQRADGKSSAVYDEDLWHRIAEEMGMRFTEQEILDLYLEKFA